MKNNYDAITRMIEEKYPNKTVGNIKPVFLRGFYDTIGDYPQTNVKDELLFGDVHFDVHLTDKLESQSIPGQPANLVQVGYQYTIGIMDYFTQVPGDELVARADEYNPSWSNGFKQHHLDYKNCLFNALYFNMNLNANVSMYFSGLKLQLIDK